jgi:hypothetical protein
VVAGLNRSMEVREDSSIVGRILTGPDGECTKRSNRPRSPFPGGPSARCLYAGTMRIAGRRKNEREREREEGAGKRSREGGGCVGEKKYNELLF